MDGNKRWSKKNKKTLKEGYSAGITNLMQILDNLISKKIKNVTVYALSSENIKRINIKAIFDSIREENKKFIEKLINEKKVKVRIIGEKKNIPNDINEIIIEAEKKNIQKSVINLNIAFNYGGDQEILNVIQNIVENNISLKDIDISLIKSMLYLGNVADPDLLIRTGGHHRLSNFLLNNLSYTELYFTDTLWPDLSNNELNSLIQDFYKIERKYGL